MSEYRCPREGQTTPCMVLREKRKTGGKYYPGAAAGEIKAYEEGYREPLCDGRFNPVNQVDCVSDGNGVCVRGSCLDAADPITRSHLETTYKDPISNQPYSNIKLSKARRTDIYKFGDFHTIPEEQMYRYFWSHFVSGPDIVRKSYSTNMSNMGGWGVM